MKKTIQDIVSENAETLKASCAGNVYLPLRDWFNANLAGTQAESKARWGAFIKALKEIGIDYVAMRDQLFEKRAEILSKKVTHEITLYTDFKEGYDKFAIVDRDGEPVGYGRTFEELNQPMGELFAAMKAIAVAQSAARNLKKPAIRLNLFVDANWLTTLSKKAAVLASTARKFNVELNIQWIPGTQNPADRYTTGRDYEKIDWNSTGALAVEIGSEPEVSEPAPEPAPVTETLTVIAAAPETKNERGPEFEAWFSAHKAEWPSIRDGWKAEGLTSKQRDQKLAEVVKAWAAENAIAA